jgi:hypothetical protein
VTSTSDDVIEYGTPATAEPSAWPGRVGAALVLLLVPLLLLALPLPPTKGRYADIKQDWVLGIAIFIAIAAAGAYFVRTPMFPKRSTLPLILFGTAMLLIGNIVWNRAFLDYTRHHQYSREVFRRAMRNFHAPVYGRYDNALMRSADAVQEGPPYSYATVPWVILSAGVAAAWYVWARQRPLDRRWDARSIATLAAFQLALIVLFALCEPWPMRMSLKISGYSEFKKDIPAFTDVRDVLRNYVERMPKLEWYGQHYPPGNLILLMIEKHLGIPGMTKAIVCLFTIATVFPLWHLAKALELDDVATSAALLLFAATTGVLVFPTINTTSLVLFPGTVCLWTLVRALRTGSIPHAVVCGLSFAFYLFFSFSASILGVLMALTTVLGLFFGAFGIRNVVLTAAVAGGCVLVPIGLLYAASRFNLIACFIAAVHGHQAQQGNEGFDDIKRWLLRSTGNVVAYTMSIVPLMVLAAGAVRHPPAKAPADGGLNAARALFIALPVTVAVAGFSGLFYVETERIWIFLTPVFALAAGYELTRRSESEGRRVVYLTLLLVLLISCTQEWFFQHYR